MDGWLKGLVATACVVVIAGGAYFGLSEYQRSQEREAAQQQANLQFCRQMISDLARSKVENYKGGHAANCINEGYVTELDFQAANVVRYVDEVRSLIKPRT